MPDEPEHLDLSEGRDPTFICSWPEIVRVRATSGIKADLVTRAWQKSYTRRQQAKCRWHVYSAYARGQAVGASPIRAQDATLIDQRTSPEVGPKDPVLQDEEANGYIGLIIRRQGCSALISKSDFSWVSVGRADREEQTNRELAELAGLSISP